MGRGRPSSPSKMFKAANKRRRMLVLPSAGQIPVVVRCQSTTAIIAHGLSPTRFKQRLEYSTQHTRQRVQRTPYKSKRRTSQTHGASCPSDASSSRILTYLVSFIKGRDCYLYTSSSKSSFCSCRRKKQRQKKFYKANNNSKRTNTEKSFLIQLQTSNANT
jgi:sensor c-di-GMP phosphodiesterase-like protein